MAGGSATCEDDLGDGTVAAVRAALDGKRHGLRASLLFAGPAVMASVAYMDPGNFATNIQAGSHFGYALLWVLLAANLVAMLFQALSARIGIATNHNLAELCRMHFPPPVVVSMWLVSEVAAMATDLAEFLGGAIGLSLLFRLPLLAGMVVTGVLVYAILVGAGRHFRPMELFIGALVSLIGLCYLLELFIAPPDWRMAAVHLVVPALPDGAAISLAVAMIGATVMPHAFYLHSGLTQNRAPARNERERRTLVRFSNRETIVALTLAGAVNAAMVMMAARAFHAGHSEVADIGTAYHTLIPLLGGGAAAIFLISLLASGVSSSVVGTMAGQIIMQGFVKFSIPVWVRRLVTMLPAFVVVWLGYDATRCLIVSQVVLSLALPAPMIALVLLARRPDVMGEFRTGPAVTALAVMATGLIMILNAVLVLQTFGVAIPGLA
jgi:manganese transport protein